MEADQCQKVTNLVRFVPSLEQIDSTTIPSRFWLKERVCPRNLSSLEIGKSLGLKIEIEISVKKFEA